MGAVRMAGRIVKKPARGTAKFALRSGRKAASQTLFGWSRDIDGRAAVDRGGRWWSILFLVALTLYTAAGAPGFPAFAIRLIHSLPYLGPVPHSAWVTVMTVLCGTLLMRRILSPWDEIRRPLWRTVPHRVECGWRNRWTRWIVALGAVSVVVLPIWWGTGNRGEDTRAHAIPAVALLLAALWVALAERRFLRNTRGLVTYMRPVRHPADWRPDEHVVGLSRLVHKTSAPDVDAVMERLGFTVVQWSPAKELARVARLDLETRTVRDRSASVLACDVRDVEVSLSRVFDPELQRDRLDVVTYHRWAAKGTDIEKHAQTLRDLVHTLPDGSTGWAVRLDAVTGVGALTYGRPRRLSASPPMSDLMPPTIQPSDWWNVPIGIDADGKVVALNLKKGPQAQVNGATGSGKSVLLRMDISSRLARGHRVMIIDCAKSGADFLKFKDYVVAWAVDIAHAQAALDAAYAESQRVKAICVQHEVPSWDELPASIRTAEGIAPLTLYFDEWYTTLLMEPEPKGLKPDHPKIVKAKAANAARGICLATIGEIVREARAWGVFIVLGTQRSDTAGINNWGNVRANLNSGVQMVVPGVIPAYATLGMAFAGEQIQAASDEFVALDDGESVGLGVMAWEGGTVIGFRVPFSPVAEIIPMLEAVGIAPVDKWSLEVEEPEPEPYTVISGRGPTVPEPAPEPEREPEREPAPAIKEIGHVEPSLDELDDDEFPA